MQIAGLPEAAGRLERAGLCSRQSGHDNVRNVFGHPLAGVDPEELIDTRPLCRHISELILGDRRYADLPRKFNIALCGRVRASLHFWTQDIGLLACGGGETAFQPLVAGRQGASPRLTHPLPVLVEPERVVAFTRALLDLFRDEGSRDNRNQARFCFVFDRLGTEGVLEQLHQRFERPLIPYAAVPATPIGNEDLVGWFPQRQRGKWTMGLNVPVGRLRWQQLEGLAVAAGRWGSGALRLTPDQDVAVVDIASGFKSAAATAVARYGLSPEADSISRSVVACTGKQFCNIAVTATKAHALRLIEELGRRTLALHGVKIALSGCPAACAQHHTADIGLKGVRVRRLLGTREGFDVYLDGGVNSQLHLALPYRTGVDVDQLPQLVEETVREFYLRHKPGQTFSAYWRERLRDRDPRAAGEGEFRPSIWECEGCGHQHHAEDPPIYCPQCAGLRRYFARLESEGETTDDAPRAVSAPA